jgi:hypothetical protein
MDIDKRSMEFLNSSTPLKTSISGEVARLLARENRSNFKKGLKFKKAMLPNENMSVMFFIHILLWHRCFLR